MNTNEGDATEKRKTLVYTVGLENAVKKIAIREKRSVNAQIVFILQEFVADWKGWPTEVVWKPEGEKKP